MEIFFVSNCIVKVILPCNLETVGEFLVFKVLDDREFSVSPHGRIGS